MTEKQYQAWEILLNNSTYELLFGGGAGGGKTVFGCGFSIYMALNYVGVRGFMGRNSLEDFKKSTLLTFYDVLNRFGLKENRDWTENKQEKVFHFYKTGSDIYYNELSFYPSDPDYNYLGSTEYTWAFIDEANQVRQKAKATVRTRIRYKLAENNLIPKLLLSCNPDKGYLYSEFYKPHKQGELSEDKAFIQALVTDNEFIDPTYIKNLQSLDIVTKERLLYGNWEYDNDPARLCEYDAIVDIFSNIVVPSTDKYIVADIARFGDDRTVISYWEGLSVKKIAGYQGLAITDTANVITEWREQYAVPLSHTLVDEDGIGGGVKDILKCRGFIAQTRPFGNEQYMNLKSQCYFLLAKKINERLIKVCTDNPKIKELITEELEQVKAKDIDKDRKMAIVPKEIVKEKIGRSPDFSDVLAMRLYFELLPRPKITMVRI